jgi:UDP-glucose 4-epimerase
MLEKEPWVGDLLGVDVDPPRRRLRRAQFHRVEPLDRRRIVDLVTTFDPHVVVHVAVWEPSARATPADALRWTEASAVAVLGAAVECPSLEGIVVRSGVTVYGRPRGSVTRPDEDTQPRPTTPFGRELLSLEDTARGAGAIAGVPVTLVRLAPVMGPHSPSPLGRLLRMPVVPVSLLSDPTFSVIGHEDAARALVSAALHLPDGAVNVVAPGAVTATQAARIGDRLPVPILGPAWIVARQLAAVMGAPIPEHVHETLTRGRTADGGRAEDLIGFRPRLTTPQVVHALFEWASIIHLKPGEAAA